MIHCLKCGSLASERSLRVKGGVLCWRCAGMKQPPPKPRTRVRYLASGERMGKVKAHDLYFPNEPPAHRGH